MSSTSSKSRSQPRQPAATKSRARKRNRCRASSRPGTAPSAGRPAPTCLACRRSSATPRGSPDQNRTMASAKSPSVVVTWGSRLSVSAKRSSTGARPPLVQRSSPAYAELLRWTSGGRAPVDERFALTLSLLPQVTTTDGDFADAIVRFWSGDPLGVAELRRQAKQVGAGRPALGAIPRRELARQRFRFLARLFVAAGGRGWLLLFDEVELIGRYSPLQRGRAYAELAGWLRPDPEDPGSPLVSVLAMTDDFDAAVLTTNNDRQTVPTRLRAKQTSEYDELAAAAEAGMRAIERQMVVLTPPDNAELDRAYARVKALHGEAFGWDPPDVPGLERLGTTRMRQYVRAWINEWDLVRLDPDCRPASEVVELAIGYDEDGGVGGEDDGT